MPFNGNPGIQAPVVFGNMLRQPVQSSSGLNQLRGIAANLSTGPGIPKHVTNVSASVSRAYVGVSSTVTVSFQRDPSDKAYGGVAVYVRGYQGNNALVQVGGGVDSPINFVLNNTGEPVNVIVQSQGNSGQAPATTAPSASIKLPLSSAGGYGVGSGTGFAPGNGGFAPPPASIGDVMRFNVFGDGSWDAVNFTPVGYGITHNEGNVAQFGISSGSGGVGGAGTFAAVSPTATSGYAGSWTNAAASTLTCGLVGPESGNNTQLPLLAFYRCTQKLAFALNTNCRYWLGLATWANGSTLGNNGAGVNGTTAFATDTPNKTMIGFRYSPGTDTHWQAVAIIPGVTPTMTLVDTGVAPSAGIHFYDMVTNAASTSVTYYIDNVKVATISSPNLPSPILAGADSKVGLFAVGDNKNTVNTATVINYWMAMSLK